MTISPSQRIVCFDLGGVLVRICRSWDEACSRAQVTLRKPEWLSSSEGRARRWTVVERYQRGELDTATYFEELSEALDRLYSPGEVERIHDAWTLEEYTGALDLVRDLGRVPNLTTACLSNTNAAHWRRLVSEDGRAEYPAVLELHHRLASHLLRCAKPAAQIYELAAAALRGERPSPAESVIFFDDLPDNVRAARAIGWTAFEVDHEGDTAGQMRKQLAELGIPV
jgi:FMN phosphatase YigB (HAD superfamily)